MSGPPSTAPKALLWAKLRALSASDALAFGHEDSTAYGVGWAGDACRSDIKSICGDYPAVHGWDLGGISGEANLDGVPFATMRQLIVAAAARGGINTISWHMENYVSGADSWSTKAAVAHLLPGGSHHAAYLGELDRAADFFSSLVDAEGQRVALVFRPFHEHTGSWFWWGAKHTTEEDYIALFRFTVDYLRRARGQSQLLVAFSPEASNVSDEASYLSRYPGDDVVDVLGLDLYYGDAESARLVTASEIAVALADTRDKVAAITEFGVRDGLSNRRVRVESWFTEQFLEPLRRSSTASKVAYALAWRNASEGHHFAPYPGHASAADFQKMCHDASLLLESDLARFA